MAKSPPPTLQLFVNWYNKCIKPRVLDDFKSLIGIIQNPSISDYDKAVSILLGRDRKSTDDHAWYLRVFHPATYNGLLIDLSVNKPWANIPPSATSFEDLYNWVEGAYNRQFVGQLIIYDIALRLAVVSQNPNLMPDRLVYIHALPLAAFKWLCACGFIPSKNFQPNRTECITIFANAFGNLESYWIEDLLCHISKSMRRVCKGITPKFQCETAIDNLVHQFATNNPSIRPCSFI